jgi:REP element-mobilizing transposase RayT
VAALNLQLVFVTKYRRGVLTGKHLDTLGEVFASVGADLGAELAAAPTLPGAQPPGAPVAAVVLRVLSWW